MNGIDNGKSAGIMYTPQEDRWLASIGDFLIELCVTDSSDVMKGGNGIRVIVSLQGLVSWGWQVYSRELLKSRLGHW